jgi:amino acid transporter
MITMHDAPRLGKSGRTAKEIHIQNLYSYMVLPYSQVNGNGNGTRTVVRMDSVRIDNGKGLRAGAIGLLSSVVIAVSSTAPAYSLAATLGLVVAIVGVHSPGTLIVSFLPMLCIAYAFRELNKVDPDCGTTFTWTTRAFGPWAGWLGGWGIIAADVIVMASLSQIAGHYALLLVGADGAASSTLGVTIAGVVFIAALTWVCYRGIEVSARLQQALLAIELVALGIFAVVAFVKAGTGHALPGAGHVSAAWLSPWTGSFRGLADSFLLAVFIYWGWDCAVSVNEETKDRARTPGRAAVASTVVLVAVFAVVAVAALVFAGPAFLAAHGDNVLGAMATLVLGSAAGKLLILCVLTSATASTQTTIMPTARAVLAMAAHRALPRAFARMHPRYLTPTVATLAMGGVSAVFFVVLTVTSRSVLADSAASVGLLIAFYYGLTGFACVWFFRRDLLGSVRAFVLKGLLPGFGGLALLAAFIGSIVSYWPAASSYSSFDGIGGVFLIGAGSLLAGVALMLAARRWLPAFFTTGTLPALSASIDAPAETPAEAPATVLEPV